MTIYYLCIKTHQTTGLKYLCQTKKCDPIKYSGSGVDWLRHLDKFGSEHTTEIIRECHSPKELSIWGRYFSNLWHIVTACDDYGNKIWANKIPETGIGGGGGIWLSGDRNYQRKPGFVSPRIGTKIPDSVREKITGDNNYQRKPGFVSKNSGNNNYQCKPGFIPKHAGQTHSNFNHMLYSFENIDTGEVVNTTMNELMNRFDLNQGNLSEVISGKRKTVKRWKISS